MNKENSVSKVSWKDFLPIYSHTYGIKRYYHSVIPPKLYLQVVKISKQDKHFAMLHVQKIRKAPKILI